MLYSIQSVPNLYQIVIVIVNRSEISCHLGHILELNIKYFFIVKTSNILTFCLIDRFNERSTFIIFQILITNFGTQSLNYVFKNFMFCNVIFLIIHYITYSSITK